MKHLKFIALVLLGCSVLSCTNSKQSNENVVDNQMISDSTLATSDQEKKNADDRDKFSGESEII